MGCTGINFSTLAINSAIDDNNRGCDYEEQGNYPAAMEYYHKSANSGFYGAKANLARCYYWGLGIPKNPSYAVTLAQQAARYGEPHSQYILGHAALFGNGIRQDVRNGIYWLQIAASNGNNDARVLLNKISQAQWQYNIQQLQKHALVYQQQQQQNAARYPTVRRTTQHLMPKNTPRTSNTDLLIKDVPDKL